MAGAQGALLIGRDEELGLLVGDFDARRVNGVVIAGPMGVGKSRLAAEVVGELEARGNTVVTARANRSTRPIPFGPFVDLAPSSTEPVGPLDLLRRISDALLAKRTAGRLVVSVDDAHLLDDSSAALLLHLAHTRAAFVVATARADEPAPDAVVSLWKDGLAERIDIQGLSEAETSQLVEQLVGGPVRAAAKGKVWRLTEGNPLFVREVVVAATAQGVLVARDGTWTWEGDLRRAARLHELVGDRLAALSPDLKSAIEFLAVGESVSLAALDHAGLADGVAEAEAQGLVVVEAGEARLSHPLYGEVVRSGLASTRAERVRRGLADAVEATAAGDEGEALRVATWRLEAGLPLDPSIAVPAARRALGVADYARAERLTRAAVDSGGGTEAVLLLGEALYWLGRAEEASAVFRQAEAEEMTDDMRVTAAIVHAAALFFGLGRPDAEDVLLRAEAALPPERAAALVAHRSSLVLFNGRVDEAMDTAAAVFAADSDEVARLRAVVVVCTAAAVSGRFGLAAAAADVAIPVAQQHGADLPGMVGLLTLGRCMASMVSGELDAAENTLSALHGLAVHERAKEFIGPLALFLGRLALLRGNPADAVERLQQVADLLADHDPGGFRSWCHGLLAHGLGLLGEADAAEAHVAQARSTRNPAITIFDCEVERGAAWAAAARGERSAALARAKQAASLAMESGARGVAFDLWNDVARLGAPREARAALEGLEAEGALPAAIRAHVGALADEDGAAALEASRRFEEVGARLLAADAAAAAAAFFQEQGRRGASVEAAARAVELVPDVVTPALQSLAAPTLASSLTAREREVVELAARGLSNREIAERLYLSVRTVGNHLNHAYSKLGLSQRSELAAALKLDRGR